MALRFSILIPTWNNLAYVQLCVDSLRKYSAVNHEIILHINEGSDGTLAWAREQQIPFSFSSENVGVCHALNSAAALASTDFICFFNDDMVALPGWDVALDEEIARIPHRDWFLSATMIEPTATGNACALAPHDYGRTPETLQMQRLLDEFASLPMQDWSGATWPPNVVPRHWWNAVGGYSTEFSPGMSSDPDFSMKLWQGGVRHFKGVASSRVYHFQARSTGKVKKNDGRSQFLKKWNLSQGAFARYYLRRGRPWTGPLREPALSPGLIAARLKAWWKR